MRTLIQLLEDMSNDEDISFPIILRQGSGGSKWNYTKQDNTIDCTALSHWPGGGNVLSCCHRLNSGLHGINSTSLNILNKQCGEFPDTDYESADGNYDCCANTKYKGIPMNLSKKEIKSLYEGNYPNKELVLNLLKSEPEYYEVENREQLIDILIKFKLYDENTGTNTPEIQNWFVFE
jgi:hypothetical protein